MKLRPLRRFRHFNNVFQVSLSFTPTHWILSEASATPTVQAFQYCIPCQPKLHPHTLNIEWRFGHSDGQVIQYCIPSQPKLHPHTLNIEWRFGHSDGSGISILYSTSAWASPTPTEYWVKLRPLRRFRHFNIVFRVSLSFTHTHWVLISPSATPTIPLTNIAFYVSLSCTPSI